MFVCVGVRARVCIRVYVQVWFLTVASILVVGPLMWVLASVGGLPVLYPYDTRRVSYPFHRYVWDCTFSLTGQSKISNNGSGMEFVLCILSIF